MNSTSTGYYDDNAYNLDCDWERVCFNYITFYCADV